MKEEEGWGVTEEEGRQDLGTFGVRGRVETGIASGTEVPTLSGRACSRHCQRDGDKTLPLHVPLLEGQQGPFLGSHVPLWGSGRVGSGRWRGRQQGRILMGYSPERWLTGAWAAQAQPTWPKDGVDAGSRPRRPVSLNKLGALKPGMRLE